MMDKESVSVSVSAQRDGTERDGTGGRWVLDIYVSHGLGFNPRSRSRYVVTLVEMLLLLLLIVVMVMAWWRCH